MNRIVFILGGARSGKSRFAELLALQMIGNAGYKGTIAYIATGEGLDEEFSERIRHHRKRRTKEFETYEESVYIAGQLNKLIENHNIFILDCLTTWLGNLFNKRDNGKIEEFVFHTLDEINHVFENGRDESAFSGLMPGTLIRADENAWKYDAGQLFHLNKTDKTLIIISNELGLGIIPGDPVSRLYRDIHGRMNQKMASWADYVYFMIAGIPVRLL